MSIIVITKPIKAKMEIRMDVEQPINLLDREAVKLLKANMIEKSIVSCLKEFEAGTNLHPTSITLSSAEYSVLSDWNSIVAGNGWMSTSQKNDIFLESWGKIAVIPGCNCKPGVAYVEWDEAPNFYDEDKDDSE